jgi:hypothetical protein
MRDAVYTLCPPGDVPDSPRIYQAIARGSIPLLDDYFQRPAFVRGGAQWDAFSARILFTYPNGTWSSKESRARRGRMRTLLLPTEQRQLELQHAVWRVSRSFECEPDSEDFVDYVGRALERFASAGTPTPLFSCRPARGVCQESHAGIPRSSCCIRNHY